jgi:hypothetical protein
LKEYQQLNRNINADVEEPKLGNIIKHRPSPLVERGWGCGEEEKCRSGE